MGDATSIVGYSTLDSSRDNRRLERRTNTIVKSCRLQIACFVSSSTTSASERISQARFLFLNFIFIFLVKMEEAR